MESQFVAIVEYILDALGEMSSLYLGQLLDGLFAVVVFVLGYSLLRVGLERLPSGADRSALGEYVKFVVPGALFAILGTVFLLRSDPALLYVVLLALAVGTGLGAVALGCALIAKSLTHESNRGEVWSDKRILLTRSAPGAFLAASGLITTVIALSNIPDRFSDYTLERRETRQEVINVIHSRLDDAVELLEEYVDQSERKEMSDTQLPD